MNGFDDDEIFGMAVHYYDENEIEVGNPPQCRIISNVHTDLTEDFIIVKAVHSAFMHFANDVLATFVYALVGVGKQGGKEFIGCCSVFQIVLNSLSIGERF